MDELRQRIEALEKALAALGESFKDRPNYHHNSYLEAALCQIAHTAQKNYKNKSSKITQK